MSKTITADILYTDIEDLSLTFQKQLLKEGIGSVERSHLKDKDSWRNASVVIFKHGMEYKILKSRY
jgi:hypothetical protein